jgi:hypothetical protein
MVERLRYLSYRDPTMMRLRKTPRLPDWQKQRVQDKSNMS